MLIPLLLLAVQAVPPSPAPTPSQAAAHAYAYCVGLTAVNGDAARLSIEEAIKRAFERCAPERQAAEKAIASEFTRDGLSEERATQETQELLQSADRTMSEGLTHDIAYHRKTGKLPPHAQN
jgi:hypothetical protein